MPLYNGSNPPILSARSGTAFALTIGNDLSCSTCRGSIDAGDSCGTSNPGHHRAAAVLWPVCEHAVVVDTPSWSRARAACNTGCNRRLSTDYSRPGLTRRASSQCSHTCSGPARRNSSRVRTRSPRLHRGTRNNGIDASYGGNGRHPGVVSSVTSDEPARCAARCRPGRGQLGGPARGGVPSCGQCRP